MCVNFKQFLDLLLYGIYDSFHSIKIVLTKHCCNNLKTGEIELNISEYLSNIIKTNIFWDFGVIKIPSEFF